MREGRSRDAFSAVTGKRGHYGGDERMHDFVLGNGTDQGAREPRPALPPAVDDDVTSISSPVEAR